MLIAEVEKALRQVAKLYSEAIVVESTIKRLAKSLSDEDQKALRECANSHQRRAKQALDAIMKEIL